MIWNDLNSSMHACICQKNLTFHISLSFNINIQDLLRKLNIINTGIYVLVENFDLRFGFLRVSEELPDLENRQSFSFWHNSCVESTSHETHTRKQPESSMRA